MDEEILDSLPVLAAEPPAATTVDIDPVLEALSAIQSVDGMLLLLLAGVLGGLCALAFFGELK